MLDCVRVIHFRIIIISCYYYYYQNYSSVCETYNYMYIILHYIYTRETDGRNCLVDTVLHSIAAYCVVLCFCFIFITVYCVYFYPSGCNYDKSRIILIDSD